MLHQPVQLWTLLCIWCAFCGCSVCAHDNGETDALCTDSSRHSGRGAALIQLGSAMKSAIARSPAAPKRVGQDEKNTCVNVQDNFPSNKWEGLWFCNQSVNQQLFNSTCRHELVLKDCDRQCGLCACSTAHGTNREHCSGHGSCSADCGNFGCKNAHCVCAKGWTGPKCASRNGEEEQPAVGEPPEATSSSQKQPATRRNQKQQKGDSKVQVLAEFPSSLRQRLRMLQRLEQWSGFQREQQLEHTQVTTNLSSASSLRQSVDAEAVTHPPAQRKMEQIDL